MAQLGVLVARLMTPFLSCWQRPFSDIKADQGSLGRWVACEKAVSGRQANDEWREGKQAIKLFFEVFCLNVSGWRWTLSSPAWWQETGLSVPTFAYKWPPQASCNYDVMYARTNRTIREGFHEQMTCLVELINIQLTILLVVHVSAVCWCILVFTICLLLGCSAH